MFRTLTTSATLVALSALAGAQQTAADPATAPVRGTSAPTPAPDMTTYMYDDGAPDQAIGLTNGGQLAWLQMYNAIGGADTITEISTMNGRVGSVNGVTVGTIGQVAVWSDPNGDGNPADAVLLEQKPWTVQFKNTDMYEPVAVSPTVVTGTFFVGAWVPQVAGNFPAPLDNNQAPSNMRSWIAGDAATFNPNCLACNGLTIQPLGAPFTTYDGVWCLRAQGTGEAPTPFCTAKAGLACGVPVTTFTGTSSATTGSGFTVAAAPARTCKSGILLYNVSQLPAGVPFEGGTLCIDPMGLRRAGSTSSQGTPGGANCDGQFSIDVNRFAVGAWAVPNCDGTPSAIAPNNPAPFLGIPGTVVFAQWWGRDSVATGSFVSAGLRFTVGT